MVVEYSDIETLPVLLKTPYIIDHTLQTFSLSYSFISHLTFSSSPSPPITTVRIMGFQKIKVANPIVEMDGSFLHLEIWSIFRSFFFILDFIDLFIFLFYLFFVLISFYYFLSCACLIVSICSLCFASFRILVDHSLFSYCFSFFQLFDVAFNWIIDRFFCLYYFLFFCSCFEEVGFTFRFNFFIYWIMFLLFIYLCKHFFAVIIIAI